MRQFYDRPCPPLVSTALRCLERTGYLNTHPNTNHMSSMSSMEHAVSYLMSIVGKSQYFMLITKHVVQNITRATVIELFQYQWYYLYFYEKTI